MKLATKKSWLEILKNFFVFSFFFFFSHWFLFFATKFHRDLALSSSSSSSFFASVFATSSLLKPEVALWRVTAGSEFYCNLFSWENKKKEGKF